MVLLGVNQKVINRTRMTTPDTERRWTQHEVLTRRHINFRWKQYRRKNILILCIFSKKKRFFNAQNVLCIIHKRDFLVSVEFAMVKKANG